MSETEPDGSATPEPAPPPEPPRLPAPTPASAAADPRRAPPPARARFGVFGALLVLILALLVAWALWRLRAAGDVEQQRTSSEIRQLQDRVDDAVRGADKATRAAESLRAQLDDASKVNQSLREQLLALGERARVVEDAVANLADKRLSGHDAMLLNEAEMLLALGAQRYTLFHDPAATIETYRLADSALAAADDAAFATVRQTVAAEIDALEKVPAADPASTLRQLSTLRTDAAQLPAARRGLPEESSQQPRWRQLLGQFVRVRHGADAAALAARHGAALARELFVLDLRQAEAAVLARDPQRYAAALDDARHLLETDFDQDDEKVIAARGMLDALARLQVAAPAPAALGAALKELRNLRATHALQETPRAPPSQPPSGAQP